LTLFCPIHACSAPPASIGGHCVPDHDARDDVRALVMGQEGRAAQAGRRVCIE
jgi:hypothetical protein